MVPFTPTRLHSPIQKTFPGESLLCCHPYHVIVYSLQTDLAEQSFLSFQSLSCDEALPLLGILPHALPYTRATGPQQSYKLRTSSQENLQIHSYFCNFCLQKICRAPIGCLWDKLTVTLLPRPGASVLQTAQNHTQEEELFPLPSRSSKGKAFLLVLHLHNSQSTAMQG